MTPAQLLIGLFFFILAGVSAAGYVFVLRPMRAGGGAEIPAPIARDQRDMPTAQAAVVGLFRLIGEAVPGVTAQSGRLQRQLISAGFRWPSALSIFLGIKYATAVMLAVAGLAATVAYQHSVSAALLAVLCGGGFGYLLPDRVLDSMVRRRMDRLRRGLPAALDLLVLAVEAGQGLDAAILDTSRGLRVTHPDLASEFTQLQLELKANTTRVEALRNLEVRCRDIEIRKFVNLLIDTDRFGTSLGSGPENATPGICASGSGRSPRKKPAKWASN